MERAGLSTDAIAAWLGLLIIPIGVLAYANSFAGTFLFDDLNNIVGNVKIRHLWPIREHLQDSRPLVSLSLALNYALDGFRVRGYHAFNLTVHLLAGLTLFGIVRRTLFRTQMAVSSHRSIPWLAFAAALLWTIHPLQTESVTYIIQRAESMMGLFYLLTLYCVIRGSDGLRARLWYATAVASCVMGMACKAVMITAPVVVFVYDILFLSRSFRGTVRRRWGLYMGLAASWLVLAAQGLPVLVLGLQPLESASVGFGYKGITIAEYALTQPQVILHYIKLSFWPRSLCLDYQWPAAQTAAEIAGPLAVVGLLLLATMWGLLRKSSMAFLGVWLFGILSPTSSFIPLKDIAFEHRMYLPLAAVAVPAVLAGHWLLRHSVGRFSRNPAVSRGAVVAFISAVVVPLGYRTVERNGDYHSAVRMWSDVVAKRPANARAHSNLGIELGRSGRSEEALASFQEAIRLDPDQASAYGNLGMLLTNLGQLDQAVVAYREAARIDPRQATVQDALGVLLARTGRSDEAIEAFRRALQIEPTAIAPRRHLAGVLTHRGEWEAAIAEYRRVLEQRPLDAGVHYDLADALSRSGDIDMAIREYKEVLLIDPRHADARCDLGSAYFSRAEFHEAIGAYREVLEIEPRHIDALFNLGLAYEKSGRVNEAVEAYRGVLEIDPDHARARKSLAGVLARQGGE